MDNDLPTLDPAVDPALAAAVLEIESHSAEAGWDQPGRLYALVDTAALVRREPALASAMGLDDASAQGSLTPVEQEQLPPDRFESTLASIAWGPEVSGCAAVVERLVLPPAADDAMPDDPAEAATYAAEHPDRQEVRMVVGVTRTGSSYCALRLRAHDDDQSVVGGADLVPELIALLGATLEPVDDEPEDDPRE
ncbi:MAG TPA: PPA1309 family protein [Nocardioides sp.]|uniref:PPA1309 family protein n=1 Tax=Nocardioides sp. TaxID=35761 RepID=UPI002E35AE61|nr:PPA1309 family protein [Nocardioides sp.]HEX5087187.1 PPA1309 family protein [Nocardioides sp.]